MPARLNVLALILICSPRGRIIELFEGFGRPKFVQLELFESKKKTQKLNSKENISAFYS